MKALCSECGRLITTRRGTILVAHGYRSVGGWDTYGYCGGRPVLYGPPAPRDELAWVFG